MKKYKILLPFLAGLAIIAAIVIYLQTHELDVLSPGGTVAAKEHGLLVLAALLSLIVIVPVYVLTFAFAWRYRASNKKAKYSPDLDRNRLVETVWWLVPGILILILSVITWNSSHQLDPFRSLASNKSPVRIQVIALDWKWLFIYPAQKIATVNYVQFPAGTPVDFEITSDAPMNSFWIPKLGGQIYAMSGMSTHLHLMADAPGSFRGSSANVSGDGFAGMSFVAQSSKQVDFDQWSAKMKHSPSALTLNTYTRLAQPSKNDPAKTYVLADDHLYEKVLLKYMVPDSISSEVN